MWRSWEVDRGGFRPNRQDLLLLTEGEQSCGLTEELHVGRWRHRGSGWGWTSEGLCLERWTDTDTSWVWRTTSLSGWKPCPWSPACLHVWPSTSWTSSHILDSHSESCPGCLMTSSRKWVRRHRKRLHLTHSYPFVHSSKFGKVFYYNPC